MKTRGYILVYNPISNEGHLDSWHVLFIEMLRKDGWRVIAMSTDPVGLQAKLLAKGLNTSHDLVVFQTRQKAAANLLWLRQARQRLNVQCDKVRYKGKAGSLPEYLKTVCFILAHHLIELAYSFYRRFKQTTKSVSLFVQQTESVLAPAHFAAAVNEVIAKYPGQLSKVLNMYIDAYRADREAWQNFGFSEDIPWSAVCITPGTEPVEGYYQLPRYRGTCFLDELVCDRYQKALSGKYFEYMPDIADIELPSEPRSLAKKITEQAAGRKIVFMGGSIGKQKNLVVWYDLIRSVDPEYWYFVQIGRINRNNLTDSDQRALDDIVVNHPANLMIYPDYLPDERDFNQIISVSDIIFAVYRDFKRSSNMLSKAAYFQKPILVSDKYLMGERVRRYKIGLTVKEDDAKCIRDALISLGSASDLVSHFEAYRHDVNFEMAGRRLCRFIQSGFAE